MRWVPVRAPLALRRFGPIGSGLKTGGRQKGSRNKRTQEREETAAETVALIGELIPDAFAGDAHAFLVPRTVTRNGVRLGDRYT